MNTKRTKAPQGEASVPTSGRETKIVRRTQLFRDPHQPRTRIRKFKLEELAASIKAEGLQQPPVVNFAYRKKGVDYYCIKEGERRWRSAEINDEEFIEIIIEKEKYDGTVRSLNRRLAQAAENGTHEPHSHGEIIVLVEESVQDAIAKRGMKHGAVEIGLRRVATAFGKSMGWAQNYHTLAGLIPEMRDMLDDDDDGERLNFNIGKALALAPADTQRQVLADAAPSFEKGGHAAGYAFIVRKVREIRVSRGEKVRSRDSDEKNRFIGSAGRLKKFAELFRGDRRPTQYSEFIDSQLAKMSVVEVDLMLVDVNFSMNLFHELQKRLQTKRDANYAHLGVVEKKRA